MYGFIDSRQVAIAEIGLDEQVRQENTNRDEDETEKGPWLPRMHTNERGNIWATVACFSAKQGLVFILSLRVSL
jgi:hypothetical protein